MVQKDLVPLSGFGSHRESLELPTKLKVCVFVVNEQTESHRMHIFYLHEVALMFSEAEGNYAGPPHPPRWLSE